MHKRKIPISFFGRSVTIACTNLERTEKFYADVLGADLIPGDGYGCRWYQIGSLKISVMPNAEHKSPAKFPEDAMPVLWLEVDDIKLAHEHLKNAGTRIIQAPDDDMLMVVTDPDGQTVVPTITVNGTLPPSWISFDSSTYTFTV